MPNLTCLDGNQLTIVLNFYRPQTKLRKGNVFTSVCQDFCPQGEGKVYTPWADAPGQTPPCVDPPGQTPLLGRHPPGRPPAGRHPRRQKPPSRPPWADTPPPQMATAADGTYPTGMHACFSSNFYCLQSLRKFTGHMFVSPRWGGGSAWGGGDLGQTPQSDNT